MKLLFKSFVFWAVISQPTYVNMHELASMAASKHAQDSSNLPPPPAEFTTPPTNEKVSVCFTSLKCVYVTMTLNRYANKDFILECIYLLADFK